jgi:hypothetical protein
MNEVLQLSVVVTPHTADAVTVLRRARAEVPRVGSLCAALDASDPAGEISPGAYREALGALDVGARVFGHASATEVGAHHEDAALVIDVAVYHLTGSPSDVRAALTAFRRAAGPRLETTRR